VSGQERPLPPTSGGDPAKIVTRLVDEVINGGDTRLLGDLLDPEHVTHDPTGDLYGPEGMRIDIAGYRTAFPDLRMTTEDLVADGDRVARRFRLEGTHSGSFMGIPPSGQRVDLGGIAIHRVAGGRLVETWLSYDCLGLIRQLGSAESGSNATPEAD
jgi:predicted ester cyclase